MYLFFSHFGAFVALFLTRLVCKLTLFVFSLVLFSHCILEWSSVYCYTIYYLIYGAFMYHISHTFWFYLTLFCFIKNGVLVHNLI